MNYANAVVQISPIRIAGGNCLLNGDFGTYGGVIRV